MYVTKLLSTKSEEYTFENHTEILQIDGNRARTIKEVDQNARKQVTKEYKPGNYIPPTGAIIRKGYTAIMIISLLIIGMGAFVIKKKVLKQ